MTHKIHGKEHDKYLDTPVTNTLHVDNKRTDTYLENGSVTKPFKTIQAAIDAVVSSSATNKYLIEISPGPYYSDPITINKVYVTFRSCGVQGARISGLITVTNPGSPTPEQITFVGLRISGGLICSASHIAINAIDCNITGSDWNINPTVPTDDEYLQVWGGLFYANCNLTNVYAYLMGGGYYSTFVAENKEFNINNADINTPFQVTLNGTVIASAYGNRAGSSNFILNVGATLNIDADTEGGSNVTVNPGATLNRTTKASNVNNDSSVTGVTVKDALEALKSSPGGVLKIETYTQDELLPNEEMVVNHSAPTLPHQVVTEIYGLASEVDETLDFDEVDRPNYYEEDDTKTDFRDGLLVLENTQVLSPYAHYHLNELSGTLVADCSGNNRNGTGYGLPTIIDGKLNKAKNFNPALAQYIGCGEIAAFEYSTLFSVEFWVRTTYAGGQHMVVCKMSNLSTEGYTGWQVALNNGQVNFLLRGGGLTRQIQRLSTTTTINDGNWHQIICTYDGSNTPTGLHIYVDSVLNDGATSGTTVLSILTERQFCIGSRNGGWLFTGDIDEVVIYKDKILNQSEVDFRYNSGSGRENVGYYDITKGWYVRTNTNQINTSSWQNIVQIDPITTEPAGTQIKFLVSLDNRVTWKKWNGATWDTVALANIDTQGNTAVELIALIKDDWDLLFVAGTLDIVASLKSTVEDYTPELDTIQIHCSPGYTRRLGDSKVSVTRISTTQHKIKNINTEPIYQMSITLIIP